LSLRQIRYHPAAQNGFAIDHVELHWDMPAILRGRLDINRLAINGMLVTTVKSSPADEFKMPEIRLPLQLRIADLSLSDVRIAAVGNKVEQAIASLHASLTVDDAVHIDTLQLRRQDLSLELTGAAQLASPHTLQVSYRYRMAGITAEPLQAHGTARGDVNELLIEQVLAGPFKAEQSLTVTDLLRDLRWRLKARSPQLELSNFFRSSRAG
jgi:hypothetical protein